MSQPQQPQQHPEPPPPEADTSSVMPMLVSILAAYAAYRASKGAVSGPWRAAAGTLGLVEMAGNGLENIARRGLDRQRRAVGRSGDELWMHNEQAVRSGVDAGIRTLVDILKTSPEPEPTVHAGPDPADMRRMAQDIAESTVHAAQNEAAARAGWDKIWRSQDDGRVRASHALLDRQRVAAGEPFRTYEDIPIRYPHDPGAPYAEIVNCRCGLKWVRAATRKH